jgi:hypothetical protein
MSLRQMEVFTTHLIAGDLACFPAGIVRVDALCGGGAEVIHRLHMFEIQSELENVLVRHVSLGESENDMNFLLGGMLFEDVG